MGSFLDHGIDSDDEWVLDPGVVDHVRWGWETFPVGWIAAFSLTWDSVVLVQVAEWLVPESLVFWILFPEEAVDGEDTNAGHFFLGRRSDDVLDANDL